MVGPLPSQDHCQPRPTLPRLFEVYHYRWPFVVPRCQYSPQVLKRGDCLKRSSIGLEGPLCTLPYVFFCHPLTITLRPLGALGGGKMPTVQRYPGYQYFTPGAPRVGEVSLLQDNHCVPAMPVKEMDPHFRPHLRPSPTPLNGEVPQSLSDWEINLIRKWLSTGGRGTPMTSPTRCLLVMPL